MKTCQYCKKRVLLFRGYWWSDDDDFQCPDGQHNHGPKENK